jgi:hypothetical protein
VVRVLNKNVVVVNVVTVVVVSDVVDVVVVVDDVFVLVVDVVEVSGGGSWLLALCKQFW